MFSAARVVSVREALLGDQAIDGAVSPEQATKTAPPRKAAAAKPVTVAKKTPTPKAQLTKPKAKTATPPPKKVAKPDAWSRAIENLRHHPNNRPTTSTALERHLANLLGMGTPQAVVNTLIARLQREGVAVENGKKIECKIPDGKK